ncbi:hypothetical protein [uncultured Megasphaera sp.]|uniref:hypothetical protein n=1 Tax=uncultured Megasphaera sp. TaxID=165188 RepID=UPI0025944F9A|nr:hypothetical protein [uncultured Megasphaera sp.]
MDGKLRQSYRLASGPPAEFHDSGRRIRIPVHFRVFGLSNDNGVVYNVFCSRAYGWFNIGKQ